MKPELSTSGNQTFPAQERLKHSKQIEFLFRTGDRFNVHPIRVVYALIPNQEIPTPKLAVSVSKKYFKKAVDRNKIKRLLREAYRKNKSSLINFAKQSHQSIYMMWIYLDHEIVELPAINKAANNIISKISKLLNASVD